MGSPSVPCDSSLMELGSEDEGPAPSSMVDPDPPETVGADHPLFSTDIEGLTSNNVAWMRDQFLDFYSENTQLSMEAKFARFQRFMRTITCRAFPHTRRLMRSGRPPWLGPTAGSVPKERQRHWWAQLLE